MSSSKLTPHSGEDKGSPSDGNPLTASMPAPGHAQSQHQGAIQYMQAGSNIVVQQPQQGPQTVQEESYGKRTLEHATPITMGDGLMGGGLQNPLSALPVSGGPGNMGTFPQGSGPYGAMSGPSPGGPVMGGAAGASATAMAGVMAMGGGESNLQLQGGGGALHAGTTPGQHSLQGQQAGAHPGMTGTGVVPGMQQALAGGPNLDGGESDGIGPGSFGGPGSVGPPGGAIHGPYTGDGGQQGVQGVPPTSAEDGNIALDAKQSAQTCVMRLNRVRSVDIEAVFGSQPMFASVFKNCIAESLGISPEFVNVKTLRQVQGGGV